MTYRFFAITSLASDITDRSLDREAGRNDDRHRLSELSITKKTRDARARELLLWRVISAMHVELCGYDPKALRALWADYARDLPRAVHAREMLGPL